MNRKIAVIGRRAGGMMAAYAAASQGAQVTLFEKNEKLGKKLYLTGKGRCNLTNAREIEDFFAQIPRNPKFLYSAFYTLTNDSLLALLKKAGLETKTERGGRVLPVSDKSSDVIRALSRLLKEVEVTVRLNEPVRSLSVRDGRLEGIETQGGILIFDGAILATGGLSYRATGSDGAGHEMAKKIGHTVTPVYPSLIPMVCAGEDCKRMQGLSLKNVRFTLKEGKKELFSDQGRCSLHISGFPGRSSFPRAQRLENTSFRT